MAVSRNQFGEDAEGRREPGKKRSIPKETVKEALGLDPDEYHDDQLSSDPALRLRQLQAIGGGDAWEYIKTILRPMLLVQMPREQMAQKFDVRLRTLDSWIARNRAELRHEATNLQPRDFVMDSYEALKTARVEAWRNYNRVPIKQHGARNVALQVAMRAEAELLKLGQAVGILADRPLSPGANGDISTGEGGVSLLADMAKNFLSHRPGEAPSEGFDPLGPDEDIVDGFSDGELEDPDQPLGRDPLDVLPDYDDDGVEDAEVLPEPARPPLVVRKRRRPDMQRR